MILSACHTSATGSFRYRGLGYSSEVISRTTGHRMGRPNALQGSELLSSVGGSCSPSRRSLRG